MANTTLRDYLDDLQALLEQEALEEVIGHCRHILQYFPKNVETYLILGRALLEKSRFSEAVDVFQRVLSVTPDDSTAHLGLSGAWEEQQQLPNAVWHLERAFEQDPHNPSIKAELRRLYERRDGSAPERIQLTRGALARMYLKGQLYEQAIQELKNALNQNPERVDLQILLATALWESERLLESSDAALKALESLPDSLEPNRIMAALWLKGGRPSEAEPFIARLEQVDPFLAWTIASPDVKPLPREAFQLPQLVWDARTAAIMASDAPEWMSQIADVFEAPEAISLSGSVTDWTAPPAATTAPAEAAPSFEMPNFEEGISTPAQDVEEAPDWFKGAPAAPAPAKPARSTGSDVPDWLEEAISAAPPKPTPKPADASWLADDDLDLDLGTGQAASAQVAEELPSGFTDLLERSGPPHPSGLPQTPASGVPDWLADVQPPASSGQAADALSWLDTGPLKPPADTVSTEPAPAGIEEDALDWLAAPAELAPAEEKLAEPAGEDWLSQFAPAQPAAATPESTPTEANLDDLFGGSIDLAPAQEQETAAEPAGEDWLSQFAPAQSAAATPAPTPTEANLDDLFGGSIDLAPAQEQETAAEPAGEDWLSQFAPAQPAAATPESTPTEANLDDLFGESIDLAPTEQETAAEPAGEDWLSQLAPAQPTAVTPAPAPAESDVEWLGAAPGAAPTEEQPTQPAGKDWLGTPSTGDLAPTEPKTPAPAPTQGGWLDSLAAESSVSAEVEHVPADPLAWAHQLGLSPAARAAEEETTPVESPAWAAPDTEFDNNWLSAVDLNLPSETPIESAPPVPVTPTASVAPAEPVLESDWLESFEPGEVTPIPGQPQLEDEWLASFESPAAAAALQPETVDALDWMMPAQEAEPAQAEELIKPVEIEEPPAQPARPTGMTGWLTMPPPPEPEPETTPEPVDDMPAWMVGTQLLATPESEGDSQVDNLLKLAKKKTGPLSPPPADTGVLDPGAVPDWLNSLADGGGAQAPAAPAPAAGGTDSAAPLAADWLASEEDGGTAPGALPDWLSDMAPGAPKAPTPLEALDFSALSSFEETPASADEEAETFDFDFKEILKPGANRQPETPLADLDFEGMDEALTEPGQTAAPARDEFSFDLGSVAQGPNLMNTNTTAQTPQSAPDKSFDFKRSPSWMRKGRKQAGTTPPQEPKRAADDQAQGSPGATGSEDADSPDWLRK